MKQSPAAVGWWALSARKHRRVPPAPPCTSPTCSTGALPTCQQTPALFLAPWALRWELHWGLPSPLVASTLVLPGRVTCQCHTATPATGALQGLVLVCNTSADMVWLMSNLRAPEAQTFPVLGPMPASSVTPHHPENPVGKGCIWWHLYAFIVTHIQVVSWPGGPRQAKVLQGFSAGSVSPLQTMAVGVCSLPLSWTSQ